MKLLAAFKCRIRQYVDELDLVKEHFIDALGFLMLLVEAV